MDDWLTSYHDWWKLKVSGRPLLWLLCLITAVFAPPVLASLVFDFGSAVVLTTFLVSALLFLPGMLIAGLAFVQIGAFQMRDKSKEKRHRI
ncbi:hypothetical protein [Ruegeria denitrificans]|uniref:hypothetical protein n=1 Tax=Ruegeria denitrificans TaxID=1715692 RepID=UPI003C7BEEB3